MFETTIIESEIAPTPSIVYVRPVPDDFETLNLGIIWKGGSKGS
jgi:hypothetical protein